MGAEKLNPNQFKFKYQLNEGVHNLEALYPDERLANDPEWGQMRNRGWMQWRADTGEMQHILVTSDSRRQGVATTLWNRAQRLAEERGITAPQHSPVRTREGNAWAKKVGGDLPKKKPGEYGYGRIEGHPVDPDKYEKIDFD